VRFKLSWWFRKTAAALFLSAPGNSGWRWKINATWCISSVAALRRAAAARAASRRKAGYSGDP